jgi:hypothetical protein
MFQSPVGPLLRENVHFLKGSSRAQVDYMMKCVSQMSADLGSPGVWAPHLQNCMAWLTGFLPCGQRKIRGRKTAFLNQRVTRVNLGLFSMWTKGGKTSA